MPKFTVSIQLRWLHLHINNSRNETEQSLGGQTKWECQVYGLTAAGQPGGAVDNPDTHLSTLISIRYRVVCAAIMPDPTGRNEFGWVNRFP